MHSGENICWIAERIPDAKLALVLIDGWPLLAEHKRRFRGHGADSRARQRVREALRNTEKLSNTFLYKETVYDNAGKHETDVRGLVVFVFRYLSRVATDG